MTIAKDKELSRDKAQFAKILKQVQTDRKPIAEKIIKELTFIIKTLDLLKVEIEEHGPTDNFKQGVQEFMRESPALKAYNTTIQRFSLLYKQLSDLLPKTPVDIKGAALLDFIKDGQ